MSAFSAAGVGAWGLQGRIASWRRVVSGHAQGSERGLDQASTPHIRYSAAAHPPTTTRHLHMEVDEHRHVAQRGSPAVPADTHHPETTPPTHTTFNPTPNPRVRAQAI